MPSPARTYQEKVRRLVQQFAPTVCSAFYDDYHLPAYTYDKTSCGLIDAYRFAGVEQALAVHTAATEAVVPHLPEKALSRKEQYARPHKDEAYCWDETYTLPENLFLAYRLTGNPRYRELATRFIEDDLYFDPLSRGENVLPGEHAYSHVNAFSSAMQAYLVLGNPKHLRAARNGFDFLRSTQSFATGGWDRMSCSAFRAAVKSAPASANLMPASRRPAAPMATSKCALSSRRHR